MWPTLPVLHWDRAALSLGRYIYSLHEMNNEIRVYTDVNFKNHNRTDRNTMCKIQLHVYTKVYIYQISTYEE
jgi:hypothetical protein